MMTRDLYFQLFEQFNKTRNTILMATVESVNNSYVDVQVIGRKLKLVDVPMLQIGGQSNNINLEIVTGDAVIVFVSQDDVSQHVNGETVDSEHSFYNGAFAIPVIMRTKSNDKNISDIEQNGHTVINGNVEIYGDVKIIGRQTVTADVLVEGNQKILQNLEVVVNTTTASANIGTSVMTGGEMTIDKITASSSVKLGGKELNNHTHPYIDSDDGGVHDRVTSPNS